MATISYDVDGVRNVIFFDATMSEDHEGTADVTEHDVERGADLADHVRAARPGLSLSVMISNTPIASSGRLIGEKVLMTFETPQEVVNSPANGNTGTLSRATKEPSVYGGYVAPFSVPGAPRAFIEPSVSPGVFGPNSVVRVQAEVFTFPDPRDRLRDIWDALNELRVNATLLNVSTRLQDYTDMLITRVGGPVTGVDAITFALQFKQIGFADSLTFAAVDKVAANAKKAKPKKDQGPKKTFKLTKKHPQSLVDMAAQKAAGYRTSDEVLADHPNPSEDSLEI